MTGIASPSTVAAVVATVEANPACTAAEVAIALGLSLGTAQAVLLGLYRRGRLRREVRDSRTLRWFAAAAADPPRPATATAPVRSGRWATAPQPDELRALVAGGATDNQIAEWHGLTRDAVRGRRHALGLFVRGPYAPPSDWAAGTRRLHEVGATCQQIADASGCTLKTARQRLWMLGLKAHRKPKEEPP